LTTKENVSKYMEELKIQLLEVVVMFNLSNLNLKILAGSTKINIK